VVFPCTVFGHRKITENSQLFNHSIMKENLSLDVGHPIQ
jgi:hypothetical protein